MHIMQVVEEKTFGSVELERQHCYFFLIILLICLGTAFGNWISEPSKNWVQIAEVLLVVLLAVVWFSGLAALVVWVPYVLIRDFPSTGSDCTAHDVWTYCFIVALAPIWATIIGCLAIKSNRTEFIGLILVCLLLCCGWGVVLLSTRGDCWKYHERTHPDLILLAKICIYLTCFVSTLTACLFVCSFQSITALRHKTK